VRVIPLLLITALLACAHALTPSAALAADDRSEIGGTVYFDRDRDGKPSGGDPGLRGIQVTLTGPKGSRKNITDAKGTYTFDDLPAGQYTITAAPPSGHQLTTALSVPVKVDGKNAIRVIDFGVAAQAPGPSPSPSASPTAKGSPTVKASPGAKTSPSAKASPTVTPTVTTTTGFSPLVQRPNAASSPQAGVNVSQAISSALDARARLAGSPAPIVIPTMMVTPTATPDGGRGGAMADAVRLRAASLEPLRYAPGRDRLSAVKRYENGETVWLGVPFRTQMDGTYFSAVNCGPASLAMAMGAFGVNLDPNSIREYVNFLSGNVDPDSGTSLDHIARVAREAGLRTLDLYSARGYRVWDLDLIRQHVAQGHPVITLTRYQSLPGNANSRWNTDHYIVITGLSGDDFIYNDPAYGSNAGYGLLISGPDLERAWVFSSIPAHSLALAVDGDSQIPDWLRRRAEARVAPVPAPREAPAPPEAEVADALTYTGGVPGDQELPPVSTDLVALTLLDLIAAPRVAEQAFVAAPESIPAIPVPHAVEASASAAETTAMVLPPDALEALLLPPSDEAPPSPSVRLAEVFILDPALVTIFLALLGIFLPPALNRRPER
jgi:hypothetical protein